MKRAFDEIDTKEQIIDESSFNLYDVDFKSLNNKELISHCICTICQGVTSEPHMIKSCQHTFCNRCITEYVQYNIDNEVITCPNCKASFDPTKNDVVTNNLQKNIIDGLQVKCISSECGWEGLFSEFHRHVKSLCEYVFMCSCDRILLKTSQQSHLVVCPNVTIRCVCGQQIIRRDQHNHSVECCPEYEVHCSLLSRGCLWKGKRKEFISNHIDRCMVAKLYSRYKRLKRMENCFVPTDSFLLKYKDTDLFTHMGFIPHPNIEQTEHRKFLLSCCFKTFDKLGYAFQTVGGSILTKQVEALLVLSTGLFPAIKNKSDENFVRVDIDFMARVMAITFSSQQDRIFIIPTPGSNPMVTQQYGGRIEIEFDNPTQRGHIWPVLYAHRRWIRNENDNGEYPYIIEPSSRCIHKIVIKHTGGKTHNNALYSHIKAFFDYKDWL